MTTLKQKLLPSPMQGGGFGGGAYLLRDEFSKDEVAGAVNGTPAVPGPGTRVVVDTGSRLSLANGLATFATGGGSGDPAIWINLTPNIVGRVCLAEITPANTTTIKDVGWDSNQAGAIFHGLRFNTTPIITLFEGGVPGLTIGAYGAVSYRVAIVSRGNGLGFWAYILGGAFTNWTLLYISPNTTAAANLAPVINSRGAITSSFLRVPQSLYIPSLWYDSFTRANGALGSSESVGPDGQATPITAWVNQEGTFGITGNAAQATALAAGIANATLLTTYADAHIRATLTRAAGNIGINARYQDSSNYLRAYHDGTNAVCQQVVAGVPTTLRTGAAAFGAGVIYLLLRGTTGWLFYNNAAVGASFTVPASVQAAHGLHTTDLGNTVTVFEAWPDGGNGEHGRLSSM